MRLQARPLTFLLLLFAFMAAPLKATAGDASAGRYSASSTAVERPRLGVLIEKGDGGVLVSDVSPGSPAFEAGLLPGDVIVRMNGVEVPGVGEFVRNIHSMRPDGAVVLSVSRAGKVEEINVVLASPPGYFTGRRAREHGECRSHGFGHGAGHDSERMGHAHGWDRGKMSTCQKYGKMNHGLLKGLGLDQAQRQKASAIVSDYRKKSIRLSADIRVIEVEVREMMAADRVVLDKVRAKVNEMAAKEAELRFLRLKSLYEIRSILTDEQRSRLRDSISSGEADMDGELED